MRITRTKLIRLITEAISLEKEGANPFNELFTNELGNDIELNIQDVEGDPPGSLTITMTGPDSQMENTITRMEAERLHDMLMRYLEKDAHR